jgi:superfamily II DNA helicase RecQ
MSNQSTQLPLPLPEGLRQWLTLNTEFHVLICHSAGCYQALSPGAISRHLRDKHQVNIELRKQLEQYIEQWQWPYDSQNIPLPPAGLAPQPAILVLDGFQCQDCEFTTQSRKAGRVHGNVEHNKKRVKDEEIFISVRLQTWVGEKRARYWVVDESKEVGVIRAQGDQLLRRDRDNRSGSGHGSGSGESEDENKEIKKGVAEWSEVVKERRLVLNQKPAAVELDPWLRYTDWVSVLAKSKYNLTATAHFVRMPDPEEWQLIQVLGSWNRILERCLNSLEVMDHKDVLKWWASPKNEVASQNPFEKPQNQQTLDKYSLRWQSFLCYIIRTSPEDNWEDETETGVKFTEKQWKCIDELRGLLEERQEGVAVAVAVAVADKDKDDPELDTAVMGLIVSIVTQDTSRVPLYESPLMHYLAVCGIDPVAKAFREAFVYTPILAQVLWIVRLLLLEIALPLKAWPELGLKDRSQIGAVAVRVDRFRQRHLCEGSFSPTSSILTQLARGKAINKLHRSPSNIYWSDDRQTVFYTGKGVAMAKIRVMWQELTRELKAILFELVFHQDIPEVPLPLVIDQMGSAQNFRRDNLSFMDHPENQETCKRDWEFLYQRMLQDAPQWRLVSSGSSGSGSGSQREWIDVRRSAYLNRERQFLRLLMVAMHFTGGQPARGPELGSIKVVNSKFSARNIYIINGRVVFLTKYDKAQKRRNNVEYVLRCLPLPLSQILVQYLIYVRPFSQVVGQKEWDYLFADERGPWAGNQLSAAVAVATAQYLGVRLTILGWRQVAIAIANEHLGKASKTWDQEENDGEDDEFAEGEDEAEVELNLFEHILVRQSAHGQGVAQRHYAVDGAFLNFLGPELVNAYTQASRAWHTFFEIKPEGGAMAVAIENERVKHSRQASQQLQPRAIKRERSSQRLGLITTATAKEQALEGLRRIYGPTAQPQSEGQATALELVHQLAQKTSTSIIVLPTSSGKTVLFFSLAAMVVNQTVIVVVPFAALVDDLVLRAKEIKSSRGSGSGSGLTCQEWIHKGSIEALPQLIIISADRAVQGDFLHFAKGLELHGQLAHMFFDECHVAFTDTSYRRQLQWLWQLRYLDCPFTCLTATLLVSLEDILRERLLIKHATLFRRSTMRRTIRYKVIETESKGPLEYAKELIPSLPLPLGKRGVIYVRSYAAGEALQEEFGFPFYKARCEEKAEVLAEWVNGSGSGGWILATGALGTGVNIADIIYVVHIDRPYGLTSFMQQSGRGGRSGEVSDSIVVISGSNGSGSGNSHGQGVVSVYSVEHQDETALEQFLTSATCRREVLAREFDGDLKGSSCIETDSIRCDRCEEGVAGQAESIDSGIYNDNSSGNGSGKVAIEQRLKQETKEDQELFQVMDELQRHCIYCQLIHKDQDDQTTHLYRDCSTAEQVGSGFKIYEQWRRQIRLTEKGQCYRCGLGEDQCQAVEEGIDCAYPGLMLAGIFILHMNNSLLPICDELGYRGSYLDGSGSGSGLGEQWQWLNRIEERWIESRREIRWMQVWRLICSEYSRVFS